MRDQDRTTRQGMKRKALLLASALAGGTLAMTVAASPAMAQGETATQQYTFDIPAGPLSSALAGWAQVVGYQYAWSDPSAQSQMSPGVKGRMTAEEALRALTAGSGVSYSMTGPRTVMISAGSYAAGDGERVTGAVRVEGYQGSPYFGGAGVAAGVNGANGSRDITATEGTGSFTSGALTIGSKIPQSLKDVPQSLSVLTSERMEQQNVTDFTTAMAKLPGVTLVQQGRSNETIFLSRGYSITSIKVDGGAPLSLSFAGGQTNFYPQIDMAQYDHVELLRGADGLFNGFGDPGGSVNLVRKKPLDHGQVALEAQAGSWANYRVTADVTSPLALDGKLRGRLVLSFQDNDFFYDFAHDNKSTVYGIMDFDATPTTVLTLGGSYARQDSKPWEGGLPRYQDGSDLELPRSTSLMPLWNRWNFETKEMFGSIEQKLGDDWTAKIDVTFNRQTSTRKSAQAQGAVNPLSGVGPYFTSTYQDYSSKQLSTEATFAGAFDLFGQRQELTLGINRVDTDGGGQNLYSAPFSTYYSPYVLGSAPYQPYPGGPIFCQDYGSGDCPAGSIISDGLPIDVSNFDPNNPVYAEPRNPLPIANYSAYGQVQTVAYANLKLTPIERLHVAAGLRWSRYSRRIFLNEICAVIPDFDNGYTPCFGMQIGDVFNTNDERYSESYFAWPPAVSVSYDVTDNLVAYLSYTDINESQANLYDQDKVPLEAVTGSNWEGGLKMSARDNRLNLSLAAYHINKKGFGVENGEYNYDVSLEDLLNGIFYYFVAPNGIIAKNGLLGPNQYCCFISDPNRTEKSTGIDFEVTGEVTRGFQISAGYSYNETKQSGTYFGDNAGLPFVSIQPKHNYKLWMSYDFGAAGRQGWLSRLNISGGINGQSSAYRSGTACTALNPPDPVSGISTCQPGATEPYKFTVAPYAIVSARLDYRLSDTWSIAVNVDNIFDKTYYQTVGFSVDGGHWYGAPRSFTATLRGKW